MDNQPTVPISEEAAARIRAKWDEVFSGAVLPECRLAVTVPVRHSLPRKLKKSWQKMMDGRMLSAREWKLVGNLSSRRNTKAQYVSYPMTLSLGKAPGEGVALRWSDG